MKKIIILFLLFSSISVYAQTDSLKIITRKKDNLPLKPLKWSLNEEGSHFIQFTGLAQTWVRFNGSNPGTTVNGSKAERTFDIGIRRVRFQLIGQLTDRIFFYSQVGMNSFSYLSQRKFGFFIHDAIGEYAFIPQKLSFGAGLGSWVGPLRFSSPGVATLLGYDAPIFQQTTNDLNDQFVRKPMIYIKGKIKKLDYRISLSKPFIVNASSNLAVPGGQANVPLLGSLPNGVSTFSVRDPNPQFNGYFAYQFLDQEADVVPYNTGTYLGTKKIFNIGAGLQYQNQAMWHKEINTSTGLLDTVSTSYLTGGVDILYDAPLDAEKGNAVSLYASWLYSDYGPNYTRNFAPMNPADGKSTAGGYYNSGGGTSFPINGTGNTFYLQTGYKFKNNLLGDAGTLMPYILTQWSKYNNFDDWMITYDAGINWLLKGHHSKFSFNYSNRPFYLQKIVTDPIVQTTRRGTLIVQYQVSF